MNVGRHVDKKERIEKELLVALVECRVDQQERIEEEIIVKPPAVCRVVTRSQKNEAIKKKKVDTENKTSSTKQEEKDQCRQRPKITCVRTLTFTTSQEDGGGEHAIITFRFVPRSVLERMEGESRRRALRQRQRQRPEARNDDGGEDKALVETGTASAAERESGRETETEVESESESEEDDDDKDETWGEADEEEETAREEAEEEDEETEVSD